MKYFLYCSVACFLFATGCVHRTVTADHPFKKNDGTKQTKVVEDRLIWFWQDEYRNPSQ